MERITSSFDKSVQQLQARRASGQHHWEADSNVLIAGNVLYFATLAVLYLWMKNRPALNPRLFMQFYNVSCVILAGMSGVAIAMYKWRQTGGTFVCNTPRTNSQFGDSSDGLLTWGIYLYYYQKYWEFLDTFIFMVRKSYRQVSFLHVFHHSSITCITMLAVQFDTCGDIYLGALLNSWIHVLMYGHYFLTSIGVKNAPWRPYLTSMQLVQFLVILGQYVLAWVKGSDCGVPDWYKIVMIAYMTCMLGLFANFFVHSYSKPKEKARSD